MEEEYWISEPRMAGGDAEKKQVDFYVYTGFDNSGNVIIQVKLIKRKLWRMGSGYENNTES